MTAQPLYGPRWGSLRLAPNNWSACLNTVTPSSRSSQTICEGLRPFSYKQMVVGLFLTFTLGLAWWSQESAAVSLKREKMRGGLTIVHRKKKAGADDTFQRVNNWRELVVSVLVVRRDSTPWKQLVSTGSFSHVVTTLTVQLTRNLNANVKYRYSCLRVEGRALDDLLKNTPALEHLYSTVSTTCTLERCHSMGPPLAGAKRSCTDPHQSTLYIHVHVHVLQCEIKLHVYICVFNDINNRILYPGTTSQKCYSKKMQVEYYIAVTSLLHL